MSATGDASSPGPDTGATLMEMLVVVGLMAMIATLGLASFRPALRRASLSEQASDLVLSLARTRATALRTERATTLSVFPDGRSYVAAGREVALASGVRLVADPQVIGFTPDGMSSGARLRLIAGHRQLGLAVSADGLVSRGPG